MMKGLFRTCSFAALGLVVLGTISCGGPSSSRIKKISPPPPVTCVTTGPGYYFFGYFGINPWSASEKYLLCLRVPFQDRLPTARDTAQVCMVELASGKIVPVGNTTTWNFQQGAMLQWMPTSPDTLVIYNERRDGRFASVIRNVYTGEERELPLPIAALSRSGKYAISLDFARLYEMRPGYGYAGEDSTGETEPEDPKNDGLYIMNTEDGSYRLLVSYGEVDKLLGGPIESTGNPLWFNHAIFNTDDSRIFILARIMNKTPGWSTAGLTVGLDGSNLRCILPFEWGGSHFDWKSPEEIFVTTLYKGRIPAYVIVTDGKEEYKVIAEGVLTHDGHGSFSPDRRWMVSDEYPDRKNRRPLLLINLETDEIFELGRFYSNPKLQGENRCDLHPRWNHDGTKICFDSVHEGSRRVYIMDVSAIVKRQTNTATGAANGG
jgi:hypothetical protein